MKRRGNAVICFFLACLLTAALPAEALAAETVPETKQQETQEMAEIEETDKMLTDELESRAEEGLSDEEGKQPEDTVPAADEPEDAKETDAGAVQEPLNEETPESEEETEVDPEDPGKYRLTRRGTGDFLGSSIRAQALAHQPKYSDCILQYGVDVSYHNGTIDWEKVKADGVEFAIIRVAYRGYENGALKMDNKALENMRNASAAGIPIGVYIFSQAVSKAEARQEADFIVANIKGYKIDLPVVFDFEYVATGVGRLYKAHLSKSAGTNVCTAFCDRVKALGYTPMVYASKSMYEKQTYAADISQEYPVWMAHYNNSTSYAGEYEYWQYTSEGKVDGIRAKDNPYTDLNYRYYNTLRITNRTADSLSMSWDAWDGADGYDIYRKNGSGSYVILESGVKETEYTDKPLNSGMDYSYKIYPHGTNTCIGFNTGITQLASAKLSGKGTAFDKIKLTWSKVSGAASYQIERYNSSKKAYSNIKTASGSAASYTDGSKNASTKYKYRLRPYKVVFNGRSYGGYSKIITVKTKAKVKAKTKSKKLKLRKSASKSSKSLGTIRKKGTKVTVTGSSGGWYRISVKISGKTKKGYLKKSNIKLIK